MQCFLFSSNKDVQNTLVYTVTTTGAQNGFTDRDLNKPSPDNMKTRFTDADIGVTVYTGTEQTPSDTGSVSVLIRYHSVDRL